MQQHRSYRIHDALQRGFDVVASGALLAALSPVLLVVALGVLINLGRPILFKQARPGKHGHVFELYKFRTMKNTVAADGTLLPDEDRLTPFGRALRSTSLDELPGLVNVFIGQMSFVGPRPLLVEYLPLYNAEQARRHEVRPGITGLAQVNGRNTLTWEEKFEYDVRYVDERSLWLDIRIMFATVGAIIRRTGISPEGRTTMLPFAGTLPKQDTKAGTDEK